MPQHCTAPDSFAAHVWLVPPAMLATHVQRSLAPCGDRQQLSPVVSVWKSALPSASSSAPLSQTRPASCSLTSVGPVQPGSDPKIVKSIRPSLSLSSVSSHCGQPPPVQRSLLSGSAGPLQPGSPIAALTL